MTEPKFAVAVFLLAFLAGCAEPMSNDAVIAETRKCEEAGMIAQAIQDLSYRNIRVQCIPRRP